MTDEERREELGEVYEWEEVLDLTSLSEAKLGDYMGELSTTKERALSYRRHSLQGKIDLAYAELVRHGGVALSPEELARVLLGECSSPSTGGGIFLEPVS